MVAHQLVRRDSPVSLEECVLIDLRLYSPGNWAHAITYHMPLACYATKLIENPVFVLPFATPTPVRELFELLSLRVVYSDSRVSGSTVHFEAGPPEALLSNTVGLLNQAASRLVAGKQEFFKDSAFSKRIFISRKDNRKIINNDEVSSFLLKLGYDTIYPEEYCAADQIRMFMNAESVVGVHGAGLAPLALGTLHKDPIKLVGIFPAAIVSSFWRKVVAQAGGSYVGVRGKIRAEDVAEAYRDGPHTNKFAYGNFEVCIDSLKKALDISERQGTESRSESVVSSIGIPYPSID